MPICKYKRKRKEILYAVISSQSYDGYKQGGVTRQKEHKGIGSVCEITLMQKNSLSTPNPINPKGNSFEILSQSKESRKMTPQIPEGRKKFKVIAIIRGPHSHRVTRTGKPTSKAGCDTLMPIERSPGHRVHTQGRGMYITCKKTFKTGSFSAVLESRIRKILTSSPKLK